MANTATSGKAIYTKPSDTEVVMTRVFDAPRELVFDAHTKPEHLRKWMLGPEGFTMGTCEIDLRPGGKWRVVWQNADGQPFEIAGMFKEVNRPAGWVQTEGWGDEELEGIHIYELTEKNGQTTMKWTMRFRSKEARDKAIETGMMSGMEPSYDHLDSLLPNL
jgi:uncharacterized protein YndB with AHSA1/START domain